MKYFKLLLVTLSFCFVSCLDFLDYLISEEDFTPEGASTERDIEESDYVKLLGSESSITLTDVEGKLILYANYNNSSKSNGKGSALKNPRYVTNAQGITSSQNFYSFNGDNFSNKSNFRSASYEQNAVNAQIKHFTPPQTFYARKNASSARSAQNSSYTFDNDAVLKKYPVGKAISVWLDDNIKMDHYSKKNVTLRAIGRDAQDKPVCLVWVCDENYNKNKTPQGKIINDAVAKSVADKFAAHYAHEKYIFGDEYNFLFDKNDSTEETAYYTSNTQSLVNIVIYDIGADYEPDYSDWTNKKNDGCGVVGYFYAKDYYLFDPNYKDDRKYTNQGKYFYLDAAFCNLSGTTTKNGNGAYIYAGTGTVSDTAVSTLFHEFQHMINFAQKDVNDVTSPTWYNEMLSMLAEDMMAEQLGLNESETPQSSRLPTFNGSYYESGIDEYKEGSDAIYSYAMSYAFGAWLSREFGGPEFVSLVSKNTEDGGIKSIIDAVNKKGYTQFTTSRQIFKTFIQACVFRNDFSLTYNLPSFNSDAGGSITAQGYTSKMNAIDLFSKDYGCTYNDSTYLGPLVFQSGVTLKKGIQPHGFVIHYVGKANRDTVTLYFSDLKDERDDVMIFIQNDVSNR